MISDEERGAKAVRTLMARVELPPSRVDIDLAVRTGRQGERRRRVLAVAAAATVSIVAGSAVVAMGIGGGQRPDRTTVTPAPTVTPVSCTVTALPMPQGYRSATLWAADQSGRYLIGAVYQEAQQIQKAVVWVDGSPTVLEVPDAGSFTDPTDVNSAGVVVGGVSGAKSGQTFVWTYRNGKVTKLPNPRGYRAGGPAVINERGDVAAPARGSAGIAVVVWPASAPDRPRTLAVPTDSLDLADIADDGTVIATLGERVPTQPTGGTPYAWSPDGVGRELAVPAGWQGGVVKGVHGDRIGGFVLTGLSADPRSKGMYVLARWQLRTGEVEVWPAITGSAVPTFVQTVTESGWMSVRVSETSSVLVAPDGRVLRPENREGDFSLAVWVGDDGRTIIADLDIREEGSRPARWLCSP